MKDSKQATLLEQQAKAVKTAGDVDSLIAETPGQGRARTPEHQLQAGQLAELYMKGERFDEALWLC
jgi:hypothetical protein